MNGSYELTGCPVCGGPDATEVADADSILAEVAALWEYHTPRMEPTTDAARMADRVAFSQAPPIRIARCTSCTHIYRNPRERAITDLYGTEDVDEAALSALFEEQRSTFSLQISRLARLLPDNATGIEVGSYVGAFLDAGRRAGWSFRGVDVNETAVRFARGQGFEVTHGTLEDVPDNVTCDVVSFWNCFEQLEDPRAAALHAHARLKSGGVITARVPNGAFWAALRSHLGSAAAPVARAVLARSNLLSFPYRNGFTPASMRRLLQDCNFELLHLYGGFSLPVNAAGDPWWTALEAHAVSAATRLARLRYGPPWIEAYARKR